MNTPQINVTTNYDMFRRLEGNRAVTAARAAKIAESIKAVGQVPVPIVVNENMEVVDGQGRLEALRGLGLPVYYIIVPHLYLDACVQMNITSTSWALMDYISSYAEIGNENYQRLLRLIDGHKVPVSTVCCAATGVMATMNNTVKRGGLILSEEMFADVDAMLSYVDMFVPICAQNGIKATTSIYSALCFCYQCPSVDNKRMLDAFGKYLHKIHSTTDIVEICKMLSDVYNNNRKRDKAYIETLYKEYLDGKFSWYSSRWGDAA